MEVLYEPTFIELGRDVFGLFPDGPQHMVIGAWTLNARQMYIGLRACYTPSLRSVTSPYGSSWQNRL